jgi:hypothetical protein
MKRETKAATGAAARLVRTPSPHREKGSYPFFSNPAGEKEVRPPFVNRLDASRGDSACPCGGGCPRCQAAAPGRQADISSPGDRLEREADEVADQVMRTSSAPGGSDAAGPLDTAPALDAAARGGTSLPEAVRSFFEPRFGHDFSRVRVHTDGAAAAAAAAVQARAYTIGRDIVFGAAEYAPATTHGKRLIAHELAHVIQQTGGHAVGVQRTLKVDTKSSDDPATAVSSIQPLIDALCPGFTIATSGEVTPNAGSDCAGFKFNALAQGTQPVGCCCLCTLTAAPDTWTIVVTSTDSPSTDQSKRLVAMTPTSGPKAPDLRYWTGTTPEKVQAMPLAEAFGHELCGHAALMQIKAHPSTLSTTPDRAFSDEHDPTVRVQNALAVEMGIGGDRRGLAASGTHRGESLRVFTVGPYGADADDPAPFAAQVTVAVDFLNKNEDLLVDEVGLRDASDTVATVSQTRADKVEAEVTKGITKATVDVNTSPAGPETLDRVQPATDGGVGAQPIVELRMAVRPAGLLKPIGKAPPATPVHVDAEFPAVVNLLQKGGTGINACHALLSAKAWPAPPKAPKKP